MSESLNIELRIFVLSVWKIRYSTDGFRTILVLWQVLFAICCLSLFFVGGSFESLLNTVKYFLVPGIQNSESISESRKFCSHLHFNRFFKQLIQDRFECFRKIYLQNCKGTQGVLEPLVNTYRSCTCTSIGGLGLYLRISGIQDDSRGWSLKLDQPKITRIQSQKMRHIFCAIFQKTPTNIISPISNPIGEENGNYIRLSEEHFRISKTSRGD